MKRTNYHSTHRVSIATPPVHAQALFKAGHRPRTASPASNNVRTAEQPRRKQPQAVKHSGTLKEPMTSLAEQREVVVLRKRVKELETIAAELKAIIASDDAELSARKAIASKDAELAARKAIIASKDAELESFRQGISAVTSTFGVLTNQMKELEQQASTVALSEPARPSAPSMPVHCLPRDDVVRCASEPSPTPLQQLDARPLLLSPKVKVRHALDGQEPARGALRQVAANVPPPPPPQHSKAAAFTSLREARAQHWLTRPPFPPLPSTLDEGSRGARLAS